MTLHELAGALGRPLKVPLARHQQRHFPATEHRHHLTKLTPGQPGQCVHLSSDQHLFCYRELSVMPPTTIRRRFLILAGAAAVILPVLAGVGIYGLIGQHHNHSSLLDDAASPTSDAPFSVPDPDLPVESPRALPHTTEPVRYARAVAAALFTWDTRSALQPQDHESSVIIDADPSGYETNGLIADLNDYLPTAQVWQQLRQYATTQWLTIDKSYIPHSWIGIAENAGAQIDEGTAAVTIEGTRHRTGIWQGNPATVDYRVSFTVFLACAPTFKRCHTLRLSRLNEPLK
jgi:hypothetical protein